MIFDRKKKKKKKIRKKNKNKKTHVLFFSSDFFSHGFSVSPQRMPTPDDTMFEQKSSRRYVSSANADLLGIIDTISQPWRYRARKIGRGDATHTPSYTVISYDLWVGTSDVTTKLLVGRKASRFPEVPTTRLIWFPYCYRGPWQSGPTIYKKKLLRSIYYTIFAVQNSFILGPDYFVHP